MEKPGRDFNTAQAVMQIIICLYIIIFFKGVTYELSADYKIE